MGLEVLIIADDNASTALAVTVKARINRGIAAGQSP